MIECFVDLVEQPHVLDRDHRLVGECRDQFYMLVVERPHRVLAQQKNTNRLSFAQKRDPEMGAKTTQSLNFAQVVFGVIQNVGDLKNLTLQQDSPGNTPSSRRKRKILNVFRKLGCVTVTRCGIKSSDSRAKNLSTIGLTQSGRRLHQRVEYRLQIEGRAAYNLEHVGGGGLLLQRFAQLVEQACVLDGDNGLVGEGHDQVDLLLGEWTYGFALYDDDSDRCTFAQKGDTEQGTKAAKPLALMVRIFGIG